MSALPLLRFIRKLKPSDITDMLGRENVIRRAESYAQERRVEEVWIDGSSVRAHVTGSSATPYHCVMRLHEGDFEPECSCPYNRGVCWHVGATLMTLVAEPEMLDTLEEKAGRAPQGAGSTDAEAEGFIEPVSPPPAPTLASAIAAPRPDAEMLEVALLAVPKHRLARLLAEIAEQDPIVASRITTLTNDPLDLDLRLYRQAAQAALRPGRFLRRYDVPKVASDVREIVRSIARLLSGGNPERALELVQEIAWLGWARTQEADDRDGVLAAMIQDILVEWAHAWEDIASRDRQRLARQIFAWLMEDAGAMTARLIVEAREALGPAGLLALREMLTPILEQRRATRTLALGGGEDDIHPDPVRERVEAALREVAEAQGDLTSFIALCRPDGRDGHGVLVAATRFVHEGRIDEALAWLERGLHAARGTDRASIEDLRIKLLVHLDRRREAAEAAWEAFLREPGATSYRRLIESVGETTRGEWRRRAIDSVEASADATAFVGVAVAADEHERVAHRLENAPAYVLGASSRSLEFAAQAFHDRQPEFAARVHVHLAERLLVEGDARRYERALEHLKRAETEFAAAASGAFPLEIERLRRTFRVVATWYPA